MEAGGVRGCGVLIGLERIKLWLNSERYLAGPIHQMFHAKTWGILVTLGGEYS